MLTHGHEDHIGAVPYLLRLRRDIPLVGSQLTLAFVEAKLREHRIAPLTLAVREGVTERLGVFECEFVAVNHSIPDALAVAVRTPAGTVLHTGDFKMDQLPARRPDHRPARLRPARRGRRRPVHGRLHERRGPRLHHARARDRSRARRRLRGRRAARRRRVVRVARPPRPAGARRRRAHGRRVALVGRSMVRNMTIAADLGYLAVPDGVLVDQKTVDELPRRRGRAHVHGLAGRADGGAVPDRQRRPPDRRRPGGHRDPRVVPHPRERERGVPGDQRAHPARGEGRARRQREGARLRARVRRRAPLLLQHRPAAQRHAGARRGAAPRRERRARGADRCAGAERRARGGRRRRRPASTARRPSWARCGAG